MDDAPSQDEPGPRRAGVARGSLDASERRIVVAASIAPVLLALLVLAPLAVVDAWTIGEVVWSAVVFGGLLALASGFVTADRLQARRCPRCASVGPRGVQRCGECGYDLEVRPRWACDEGHAVYLDPGLCDCGRRLQQLPPARGVAAEVRFTLRFGAWLLAFLVLTALVLSVSSG